jgi:hypothetical protein
MDERKQIVYGTIASCLGIALGFAITFPIIFYWLPYEKRGYIGVPFALIVCIGLGFIAGAMGIRLAKRGEEE